MYIALLKGDTPSGRKAGGSYVKQSHDIIKLVIDLAIKEGILVENPCLKADPPKMDTKPKKAISPEAAHMPAQKRGCEDSVYRIAEANIFGKIGAIAVNTV